LGAGTGAAAQGATEDRDSFTEVRAAGSDISAVAAGNYHTVILKNDGSVWAAGSNYWGQLGFTDNADRNTFTRLSDGNGRPLTGVQKIVARGDITVLLKTDGTMLIAGNFADWAGMTESGTDALKSLVGVKNVEFNIAVEDAEEGASRPGFVPLVPEQGTNSQFAGARSIVLGNSSIYVIDSEGRLWAAGSNRYGQLSLGLDTEASPVLKLINP
jgi:alpha-tubulin suppressor-like RCC1 family protein